MSAVRPVVRFIYAGNSRSQSSYGAIQALDGISLRVPQGAIVALLGANGSGKTTTIKAITGLVARQAGRILLEGRDLQGLPPHEVVRRGVAVVPEGRRVFSQPFGA